MVWLLAPAAAQPPGVEESSRAKKAREALQKVYTLADGKVLRCVRPPFPPERKTYELAAFDITEELLDKHTNIGIWEWGGDNLRQASAISRPDAEGHPFFDVMKTLIHVQDSEVEGEGVADLQGLKTTADFIVRAGVSQDKMIDAVNALLQRDFKAHVKLHFEMVEREVLAASGTYHAEAPLGDGPRTPVQLFGKSQIEVDKSSKSMSGVDGLLDKVGQLSARQVKKEVTNPPQGGIWYAYDPVFRLDADDELTALLKHVTEQTGLTFKKEKRMVKVLFVDRTE
jgi:hypothetical protein